MKLGKFGSFVAAVAAALYSTFAFGAVIDAEPDHFVEWLGSDGNQQIDTGYVFKTDPRVETTMMLLSDGDKDVAGMPGTSATCFIVDYKDSAKLIYYRYGATGSTNVTYPESIVDSWVDVVWGKTVSHNGVELATMPDKDFSSNTAKFFIFYARSGMPGVRFKEFKMYDGNELVRDFKPAVMEDGTACMYDTVTKKCYTNNKTGTFSVGPAVYDKDFYDITVAEAEHGSVTASPAPYAAGSQFTATAQADDGYAFVGWEGVPAARMRDNPLTLSVNRDYAITPRFGKITYVEWLGSTEGGGEYIDTGYVIKSAPTLETEVMVKGVNTGADIAGTPKNATGTNAGDFRVQPDLSRGFIWYYFGDTGYVRVDNCWTDSESWFTCSFGEEIYVNGTKKSVTLKSGWSFAGNTASFHLFGGQGTAWCRFKETKLFVDEQLIFDLLPAKVGDEPCMVDALTGRAFFNAGTGAFETGPRIVPSLAVEHNPTGLGVSDPPEGALDDPDPDKEYTFTAAARDDLPDGVKVKVLGCDLLRKNASGEYKVVESGGETGSYTFFHSADEKVVWNFESSYRVTAASADVTLGSVDKAEQWVAHGGNATVTATAVDGYAFAGWMGAPEGMERVNPLTFAVEAPWNLVANFISDSMDVEIDLSSGDTEVEIPFGRTGTLIGFTGNASANLTLKGGGTLKMGDFGTSGDTFANLVLDGCVIEVGSIAQLGTGTITASNGGGIRALADIDLKTKKFTVTDACTFDVAEGMKLTLHAPYYAGSGATLVKKGGGTLYATMDNVATTFPTSGRWLVEAGTLTMGRSSNASSAFIWSEVNIEGPTVEILTGARMQCVGALPKIVLAGGTLEWTSITAKTGTGVAYDHNLVFANNGATTFILNGGVEVLPSEKPSQICGDTAIFSGTNDRKTEINVHEGATLDVYAEFIPRLTSATATDYATVRKTGAGTLRFHRPIRAAGVCLIEEGAVEMSQPLARPNADFRFVPAGGTLRLTDATAVDLSCNNALLSSAAVWFDATKISAAEGATLSSVANLGTCGGCAWNYGLDTVAATYTAAGIGGLPCFVVNGKGGELLRTYANGGTAMTVFSVARNTSWTTGATHGEGGTPVQICNASGNAIFGYNFSAANAYKVVFGSSTQTFTGTGVVPTDDTPFINEAVWSGTSASFRQWWSDAADAFEWSGTVGAWPSTAAWVAIGSRCEYSSGMDSGRRAKGMVGQIGEVLVFNRVLTADETAYVRSYLQRKWFGSTVPEVALPATAMPEQLGVEVGEGEKALLKVQGAADIAKRDAGELVLAGAIDGASKVSVEEGTIGFNTNGWRTAAAVWVDAADASTIVMDGESVVSVANKGVTGGTFTPVESYSGVDSHPKMDAINGTAALLFEGAQGIGLDTFVPGESRNEQPLYVYLVAERTEFTSSATGPFTLTTKTPTSVLNPEGSFSVGEAKDNNQDTKRLYVGLRTSNVIRGYAGDGVPFIDVCATSFMGSRYADITAETTAENAKLVIDGFTEKTNVIDFTVLGGFLLNGKLKGETRYGTTMFDHGWKGKIGEFIVFTSPLSEDDEKELLDYLTAKWLDASAEPKAVAALPRVLGGGSTAFAGGNVDLAFVDGTAIDFESPAVTVNDLVFGSDLSLWYAPVPAKGGLAGIFAYDGEVEGFDSKEWTVTGGPRVKGKLGVVNEPGLIALDYKKNGLGIIVR